MLIPSATSPARFVHDPELVCSRGFEWSALRKRADVGLRLGTNVVASVACPGPPLLSLVKVGPSEGPHGGPTYQASAFRRGSLDRARGRVTWCRSRAQYNASRRAHITLKDNGYRR